MADDFVAGSEYGNGRFYFMTERRGGVRPRSVFVRVHTSRGAAILRAFELRRGYANYSGIEYQIRAGVISLTLVEITIMRAAAPLPSTANANGVWNLL